MISYKGRSIYHYVHYHDDIFDQLSDDIITIRAKYNVSIMLLGDFNSRVGLK